MIDLEFIRKNPKIVQKAVASKGIKIDIDLILKLDSTYRSLYTEYQSLQAKRNQFAKDKNIEEGKKLKPKIEKIQLSLAKAALELRTKLKEIPNLPLKDVPLGDKEKFELIKTEGTPRRFTFKPHDHLELGEALDIIDVQRASKVSGSRFAYLKGKGALLEFALVNFALEHLVKEGFVPIIPPELIKQELTQDLGYWQAGGNENYYLVSDYEEMEVSGNHKDNPLYLIGTAEHAIVPMHKDETFNVKDLPKKYVGFSSSFRREAGSYGKDTRGILRVHQFDKVEMVEFVKPGDDEKERRRMLSLSESFLQKLELPYRVVKLTTEDIAFPTAETIDIETWMPSQDKYRETHSISTTTDFQSRRLNIKYQDGNNKEFVHILNGTAFAIGRTIIAILENFQNENGSVNIPKVLHKYLSFSQISPKSS